MSAAQTTDTRTDAEARIAAHRDAAIATAREMVDLPYDPFVKPGELIRTRVTSTIDDFDPLVILARQNGIEVIAGEQCPDCGEAVGRVTIEGEPAIACLGALVPEPWQTCSWGRFNHLRRRLDQGD